MSHNINQQLLQACKEKKYDVVKFIIMNNKSLNFDPKYKNEDNNTLLHYIIKDYKDIPDGKSIINTLLSRNDVKTFINEQGANGDTPLVTAVKNNMNLCELLIDNGANKKIKNNGNMGVTSCSESIQHLSPHKNNKISNNINEFNSITSDTLNFYTASQQDNSYTKKSNTISTKGGKITGIDNNKIKQPTTIKENSDYSLTSVSSAEFIKFIKNFMDGTQQKGGGENITLGTRQLKVYNQRGFGIRDPKLENEITEIFLKAKNNIKDTLKLDDIDALTYRKALYQYVKKENPDMSKMDAVNKVLELSTNKKILKSNELLEIVEEVKKFPIKQKKHFNKSLSTSDSEKLTSPKKGKSKKVKNDSESSNNSNYGLNNLHESSSSSSIDK